MMAHFEVEFPEDFLSDLLDTEFDEFAEEALEEVVPLLETALKKSCASVIGHEGDSEMVNSIRCWKPKKTKTDAWIVGVKFWGDSRAKKFKRVTFHAGAGEWVKVERRYPVSNALKAIWLEYGIPGRQPPRPFIDRACNNIRGKVITELKDIYERKVGADEFE
ncbi:MAG: hypothetical protein NC313_16520 [Butyrivibrio sp.]|nr:hypothetical protein [Butyrivibrio sp.]